MHDNDPMDNLEVSLHKLRDITSRMDIKERAIIESRTIMLSMLACHPRPCWVKDLDLRMTYCNPAYTKWFGIECSDYEGRHDQDVHGKVLADPYRLHDEEVLISSQYKVYRERAALVSGKEVLLLVLKYPVTMGSSVIGVAGEVLGTKS